MDDRDLLDRLRARPFRFGRETEAEAKERRQNDREVAAWRIEALTAERDMALAEWDDCVERNRPRSAADTTAMTDLIAEIEFEAVNGEVDRHLAGRIITAMRALTAERDRLRAALEDIADHDTGATAGLAYTAKIALKGESHE